MNGAPQVKFAGDDGKKRQIVKYLLYRRDGLKDTIEASKLRWVTAISFIIVLFLNLLWPGSSSIQSHDPILPGTVVQDQVIELPMYEAESEKLPVSQQPRRARVERKELTGLGRVERSSKVAILPGTVVAARLVTGASNGPVKAELLDNVRSASSVDLPAGSFLMGVGQSTADRLHVSFARIVTKEGEVFEVEGLACDVEDGRPGLKGSQVNGQLLKLLAAAGLNFSAGMSEGMKEDTESDEKPTVRDAVLNGVSLAALEQARSILSDVENSTPQIAVAKDTEICVMFE